MSKLFVIILLIVVLPISVAYGMYRLLSQPPAWRTLNLPPDVGLEPIGYDTAPISIYLRHRNGIYRCKVASSDMQCELADGKQPTETTDHKSVRSMPVRKIDPAISVVAKLLVLFPPALSPQYQVNLAVLDNGNCLNVVQIIQPDSDDFPIAFSVCSGLVVFGLGLLGLFSWFRANKFM